MPIVRAPNALHERPCVKPRVDMGRVAALILGGGSGTRLFPLTLTRCKPAISFGGRYRLIDIPMSNALNARCNKIYIMTQFLSASLHQHILKAYRMESHSQGFVEILSAEQKPTKTNWYQGTADAIRQNVEYISECDVDYFLILSGDQLYQMELDALVAAAEENDTDLLIAALPVDEASASRMGILKIDDRNFVTHFIEKPQTKSSLDEVRSSPSDLRKFMQKPTANEFLGSMGIYLFKKQALFDLLKQDLREDFGKHLIPTQVAKGNTAAFVFSGYWEDIGTIDAFYNANIALTNAEPAFDLFSEKHPIHTVQQCLPPPKIHQTSISHSLICDGAEIGAEKISNSIIGPRAQIGRDTVIEDSYLFGNECSDKAHPFQIGRRCLIKKALVDPQVCIGNDVRLVNTKSLDSYESNHVYIRDGIIIVTRGAVIPDGFVL